MVYGEILRRHHFGQSDKGKTFVFEPHQQYGERVQDVVGIVVEEHDISALRIREHALDYLFCRKSLPVQTVYAPLHSHHAQLLHGGHQLVRIVAVRGAEVDGRLSREFLYLRIHGGQLRPHGLTVEFGHIEMVGGMIAYLEPARGYLLCHVGILVQPEPDEEEGAARVVFL